jgi:endoglucanase
VVRTLPHASVRLLTTLTTLIVLGAAGSAAQASPPAAAAQAGDLPPGTQFYVDPGTQSARWVAQNAGDPRAAIIQERIASVPQARWFTQHNPGTVAAEVGSHVDAAAAAGTVPILVAYNIPNRDCSGASTGGAPDHPSYRAWVDQVAQGLGSDLVVIILEPDVLALMSDCMDQPTQQQVMESMAYAGQAFHNANPNARVYFDAAHSAWLPPAEMAARLRGAQAAASADGISTNVSNYQRTENEIAYATSVLGSLGADDLRIVVDTSRNGNGPTPDNEWCDPPGRAIGTPSTADTGNPLVDAFLWVKLPGEADGCIAGAGVFVPDRAVELATAGGGSG